MRRVLGGGASPPGAGARRRRRRRRRHAQHGRHERVAEIRRFGAHEHLAARDRPQTASCNVVRPGPLPARDPRPEAPLRDGGGRLAERRARLREQRRAAGGRGRASRSKLRREIVRFLPMSPPGRRRRRATRADRSERRPRSGNARRCRRRRCAQATAAPAPPSRTSAPCGNRRASDRRSARRAASA